ncbi:hypothetical protein AAG570_014150 [Ranatra chinensis]|uniref:Uncharacterized protein n=1 Tax=Ranatra chinensis TaxID=642074 RepID=A0ABD0XRW5_9HEMI
MSREVSTGAHYWKPSALTWSLLWSGSCHSLLRGYSSEIAVLDSKLEVQFGSGIAIDCVDGRVYWSDIANQAIRSSKYDGTDIKDFSTIGISSPEGLTIDWINRNIYWTDSEFDTINMANLETGEGKVIASVGLVNPRGIAVHPWMSPNETEASPGLEMTEPDPEVIMSSISDI